MTIGSPSLPHPLRRLHCRRYGHRWERQVFAPDEGYQVCMRCGCVGERIPVVAAGPAVRMREWIDAGASEATREARRSAGAGAAGLRVAVDDLAPLRAADEPAQTEPEPAPAAAEPSPVASPRGASGVAPATIAVVVVGGVLLCGGIWALRGRRARSR